MKGVKTQKKETKKQKKQSVDESEDEEDQKNQKIVETSSKKKSDPLKKNQVDEQSIEEGLKKMKDQLQPQDEEQKQKQLLLEEQARKERLLQEQQKPQKTFAELIMEGITKTSTSQNTGVNFNADDFVGLGEEVGKKSSKPAYQEPKKTAQELAQEQEERKIQAENERKLKEKENLLNGIQSTPQQGQAQVPITNVQLPFKFVNSALTEEDKLPIVQQPSTTEKTEKVDEKKDVFRPQFTGIVDPIQAAKQSNPTNTQTSTYQPYSFQRSNNTTSNTTNSNSDMTIKRGDGQPKADEKKVVSAEVVSSKFTQNTIQRQFFNSNLKPEDEQLEPSKQSPQSLSNEVPQTKVESNKFSRAAQQGPPSFTNSKI